MKKPSINFWRRFLNAFLLISLLWAMVGVPYMAIQEMDNYHTYQTNY